MKNCDCFIIPFRKECIKYCIELILQKATLPEKESILGLDPDLARAINSAYKSQRGVRNFADLENILTDFQIQSLILTFSSLNQSQLDYFKHK